MRHEVIMTLDEFNQLKETREEPSRMLQDSYNNVKAKLDLAYKHIDELNASLSMYVIGGAKRREEEKAINHFATSSPNGVLTPTIAHLDRNTRYEIRLFKAKSDIPEVEPTCKSISNKHWVDDELDSLHHSVGTDTTVDYLSSLFGRTESAIRSKAISLGYRIKRKRIISV